MASGGEAVGGGASAARSAARGAAYGGDDGASGDGANNGGAGGGGAGGGAADARARLAAFPAVGIERLRHGKLLASAGLLGAAVEVPPPGPPAGGFMPAQVMPQVGFVAAALAPGPRNASAPYQLRRRLAGLHFAGRLESLAADWARLGRAVTAQLPAAGSWERTKRAFAGGWPAFDARLFAVPWAPTRRRDPHAATEASPRNEPRREMARLLAADGAARVALCRIYLPDYVCFGYPLPADCAAAIGPHEVTCAWGVAPAYATPL